jgi:hypothetical protein
MTRSAATWTKLRCDGADIVFRDHWAGLVEVACGECRVLLAYGGRERLERLPPDALIALLKQLLELARAEQRNRAGAELLCAHLERGMQHGRAGVGVFITSRRARARGG